MFMTRVSLKRHVSAITPEYMKPRIKTRQHKNDAKGLKKISLILSETPEKSATKGAQTNGMKQ